MKRQERIAPRRDGALRGSAIGVSVLQMGATGPWVATSINGCAALSKGLYAFEKWRSPGTTIDDAWVDESTMEYLSLMPNDVLRWSESEWQGPSTKSTAGDKVSTFTQMWIETPPDDYAIDTATMTQHPLGDLGPVPANKTACNGNAVTF